MTKVSLLLLLKFYNTPEKAFDREDGDNVTLGSTKDRFANFAC